MLQGVLKDGLYQLHLSPPLSTTLNSSSSSYKDHYNASTVHSDASSLIRFLVQLVVLLMCLQILIVVALVITDS